MEPHHTFLGTTEAGYDLTLTMEERFEHAMLVGATGVGKSVLLRRMAVQDIVNGAGLLYLDPHGDDAEALLANIPRERHNQVCFLDLANLDTSIGLNVLEDPGPDHRARLVDALVAAMRHIWRDSWGPRLETILRHGCTALIEIPGTSFALLPRLLTDDVFRGKKDPQSRKQAAEERERSRIGRVVRRKATVEVIV